MASQPHRSRSTTAYECAFRREGEYWTIAYDGRITRMRDAKGLRYLGRLLECPGDRISVRELAIPASSSGQAVGSRSALPSSAEDRVRKAVASRIRDAIEKIRLENEPLGRHFDETIHTGTQCVYAPGRTVPWRLGAGSHENGSAILKRR